MKFLARPAAALFLTEERGIKTSAQALADLASDDRGPEYSIINGRALYTVEGLDKWVEQQAAKPVRRRRTSATGGGQVAV